MIYRPFITVALSTHVRSGPKGVLGRVAAGTTSIIQQRLNSTAEKEARKVNYHELRQFIQYEYVPTLFNPNKSLSDFFHAHQDRFDQHIALRIFPSTIGIIPHFKGMLYYKSLLITGKLLVLNNGSTRKLTKAFFQNQFDHFSEGSRNQSAENTNNGSSAGQSLPNTQSDRASSTSSGLAEDQGKVRLKILKIEELYMSSGNEGKCLDYNVQDTISDKLVIKWELNLPLKQTSPRGDSDSALNGDKRGEVNQPDLATNSGDEPGDSFSTSDKTLIPKKQCITGLFIFEFNPDNTKISVHTIDHVVFDNDKENKEQDSVNLLLF